MCIRDSTWSVRQECAAARDCPDRVFLVFAPQAFVFALTLVSVLTVLVAAYFACLRRRVRPRPFPDAAHAE